MEKYYTVYADAALRGGMAAVCATEHFSALIHARPENRARLLGMDPRVFAETMHRWSRYFIDGASMPIIGADEQALRALDVPACVIPGNDLSHPRQVGELVARLLPRSELHRLGLPDDNRDVAPEEDWVRQDPLIAELLASFVRRHRPPPRNA